MPKTLISQEKTPLQANNSFEAEILVQQDAKYAREFPRHCGQCVMLNTPNELFLDLNQAASWDEQPDPTDAQLAGPVSVLDVVEAVVDAVVVGQRLLHRPLV